MNHPKISVHLVLVLVTMASASLHGQIVNLDSGSFTLKDANNSTVLLTGDVVQFGYYTAATSAHPFAGTFVPLTSNGSGPTTVIGQDTNLGAGDGSFAYATLNLNLATPAIPANGTIMSFVIYDSPNAATAPYYVAAADVSFTWSYSPGPLAFPQSFSLDDPNIVWENGDVGFTGIPEPHTEVLLAGGLLLVVLRKLMFRRKSASQ